MKMNIGTPKLLSITIGEEITRVVEMDKNVKVPRIYHAFRFPTPEGTLKDGCVTMTEEFATRFRRVCLENGVNAGYASFVMDSPRIVSRDVTLPQIPDKKIPTMIASNAGDYFPIDVTQHKLTYSILDRGAGEGGHQLRLTVYAVPHDIIRSYMRFARGLNLEVLSLDCVGNAVTQTLKLLEKEQGRDSDPHHVSLYVAGGESGTVMTFRRGGVTELQRTVGFAYGEVLRIFRNLLTDCGEEAEDVVEELATREMLYEKLSMVKRSRDVVDPRSVMTEAFRPLVSQLKRNIDYFFEQQDDPELRVTVYLTDLCAEVKGLDALLTSELEVTVLPLVFPGEKKYLAGEAAQFESPFDAYSSLIGGVLLPLSIAERQKKETIRLPVFLGEVAVQRSVMAICAVICAVCVSLSVCLSFLPAGENAYLKNKQDNLENQLASLGNPKKYYDLLQKAQALAKEVTGLEQAMDTYNNHLVEFLNEMERKMPKSFKAASFNVSETGVNMSVQVGSKQEAIFVIQTLRGMKSVVINAISGLTETGANGAQSSIGLSDLMGETTYAGAPIDVQTYLDMALAMNKITRAEYEAYCKGQCTDADLAKLKSFRDNGTISQEQYEAVLAFIDERRQQYENPEGPGITPEGPGVSGDNLLSDADVVSFLQMALFMNRISQEQYDRYVNGTYTPDDMTLLEGYYRTGVITEQQYRSVVAYIEARKNGSGAQPQQTVVSFTVSLSYTGIFDDGSTEAETLDPEATAPETDKPETNE